MKITSVVALGLLILGLNFTPVHAQEDPFGGDFEDLFSELEELEADSGSSQNETENAEENFESAETEEPEAQTQTESTAESESTTETSPEESDEYDYEVPANQKPINTRFLMPSAPEGKENHLLYNIPGAIEYRGMTFMHIDSDLFFNRFQKCDFAENEAVHSRLARLKISQGAPLECREDMQYNFLPYKTFRGTR